MKARSLKAAVAFYLESRRRLGFALESEGALLENMVEYVWRLHHRGPLTSELALNWAQGAPADTLASTGTPAGGYKALLPLLGRL